MSKELTKEEEEEFYNKLWLENKELIQDNMNKLSMERFELELELVDKDKEIERLHTIIKEVREIFKYYGNKEDIVGYAYYSITGESLLELLEILDKENI